MELLRTLWSNLRARLAERHKWAEGSYRQQLDDWEAKPDILHHVHARAVCVIHMDPCTSKDLYRIKTTYGC